MCPQRHQIDIEEFFGVDFTEFRTLRFRIAKIAGNCFVVNGDFEQMRTKDLGII